MKDLLAMVDWALHERIYTPREIRILFYLFHFYSFSLHDRTTNGHTTRQVSILDLTVIGEAE
jgi:hypothetical protein